MKAYDIQSIKDNLTRLGVNPKKSLGQNFLVSLRTIDKIIAAVPAEEVEQIIEIGPGLGALTYLLNDLDKNLAIIELDNAFAKDWQQQGFTVLHQDALQIHWEKEFTQAAALVSNLPYQISSSLVIDMSVKDVAIKYMVLMFQKEVAARMLAKYNTKAYGLLTVIAQAFWDIRLVLEAGPKDFYPAPTIASQVLRFDRKDKPVSNKKDFLRLVKAAFSQRRKKVINNLKAYSSEVAWQDIWLALGWDENIRAENLQVDDYIALHQKITEPL